MKPYFLCLLAVEFLSSQSRPGRSVVGTVAGFRPETAELEIRLDKGDPVLARLTVDTIAQKIAPGARDLSSAERIAASDVAAGDRVLATLEPGTFNLLRIVVMPAIDIAQRNEADRINWQKRGVSGVVAAKVGNRITVITRALTGATEVLITADEHTSFKRYAPDSVKFSDATESRLSDLNVGDQLRARGEKSEDGVKLAAEEVVFGTFLVRAGTITAVSPETGEIAIKELGTNKSLRVVLTRDSQIKELPQLPPMAGMGRGAAPGTPVAASGRPGERPMAGRSGAIGGGPGGLDINQMIERGPTVKLESLRPGSTLVVSSTKGARSDQVTAILVLANADMLIQMAAAISDGGRGAGSSTNPGMRGFGAGSSDPGGFSGLGLSGIVMQ